MDINNKSNNFVGPFFCQLCDNKVSNFIPLQGNLIKEYAKHPPAPIMNKNSSEKSGRSRFEMELFAPKKNFMSNLWWYG